MRKFAPVVCLTLLGSAGAALADDEPKAKCPYEEGSDKECPPTPTKETPTQVPENDIPPAVDPTTVNPTTPQTPPQQTPPPAQADVNINVQTPTTPVYTEPTYYESRSSRTLERWGIGVAIGGGVSGFTDNTMRDTTKDGGNWDVRLSVGLRLPIAFEGSYIGSAQRIDALGLDSDAVLLGNGVQGALRLNLMDANVQPFLFGGVAWRRYSLANENFNTSDVADRDDVLEVPMGGGLAFKYRGMMLDARGEFRYASREDMVPDLRGKHVDMHRYGATANLGFAF
jgi:hypothetical protein